MTSTTTTTATTTTTNTATTTATTANDSVNSASISTSTKNSSSYWIFLFAIVYQKQNTQNTLNTITRIKGITNTHLKLPFFTRTHAQFLTLLTFSPKIPALLLQRREAFPRNVKIIRNDNHIFLRANKQYRLQPKQEKVAKDLPEIPPFPPKSLLLTFFNFSSPRNYERVFSI